MANDGLEQVKKLKKAVERVAKRMNLNVLSFSLILSDKGDFINMKVVVPIEHFEEETPQAVQTRDEFDSMMDGMDDIFSEIQETPTTTSTPDEEEDWFK